MYNNIYIYVYIHLHIFHPIVSLTRCFILLQLGREMLRAADPKHWERASMRALAQQHFDLQRHRLLNPCMHAIKTLTRPLTKSQTWAGLTVFFCYAKSFAVHHLVS